MFNNIIFLLNLSFLSVTNKGKEGKAPLKVCKLHTSLSQTSNRKSFIASVL